MDNKERLPMRDITPWESQKDRPRVIVNTNEPFVENYLNQLRIKKEIKNLIHQKSKMSLLDRIYLKLSD